MAVGDAVVNLSSISTGAYLDIDPGAGNEWFLHKVFHEAEVELYWYDGSNNMLISPAITGSNFEDLETPVTNAVRMRVKNTNAGTKLIGYSGRVTK